MCGRIAKTGVGIDPSGSTFKMERVFKVKTLRSLTVGEVCSKRGVVVCPKCKCAAFCCVEHAGHYKHQAQCGNLCRTPPGARGLYTQSWPQFLVDQTE